MKEGKVVLVTGATGKVGQNLIRRFVTDPAWQDAKIRAFCHNRLLEEGERLEVVQGSMAERGDVARAVAGTTHVVHLATCKETPHHQLPAGGLGEGLPRPGPLMGPRPYVGQDPGHFQGGRRPT